MVERIDDELKGLKIGEKISSLRKKMGLSVPDLAEESGLSKIVISQIESNTVSPTVAALVKPERSIVVLLGRRFEATLSQRASAWRSAFILISFAGGSTLRTPQPFGAHSVNAPDLASTSANR